jgi:hypothetical protein
LQIQLRQGGSLNPEMAAMLGCANGYSAPLILVLERSPERDPVPSSRQKPGSSGIRQWQRVQGYLLPYEMEIAFNDVHGMKLTMDRYWCNVPLPDGIFSEVIPRTQ